MSRYLLDTNVVIWLLAGDQDSVSESARTVINDRSNPLILSAVSVWEIAIKLSLGKLQAPGDWFEGVIGMDVEALPITLIHAKGVEGLPPHHRDPFDRLLIAQSIAEQAPIITSDARFCSYDIEVLW